MPKSAAALCGLCLKFSKLSGSECVIGDMLTTAWKVSAIMGVASGILSVVLLIKSGAEVGLSEPLKLLLDQYNQTVTLLLSWVERRTLPWLLEINDRFGINLQMQSHWKHVFMLLWLYFASDVKVNWTFGRNGHATASLLWGWVVALITSVSAGSIPLNESWGSQLVFTIFLMGMMLYELGQAIWCGVFRMSNPSFDASGRSRIEVFCYCVVSYVLPIGILGALAHVFWWWSEDWGALAFDRKILIAVVFVFVLALYWMVRGVWLAIYDRTIGEDYGHRFWRSGSAHVGLGIFAVSFGTILFFSLNAGLKLAGL